MTKNSEQEKPCPRCVENASLALFFDVCNQSLKGKINCKTLSRQLLRGEITPEKAIRIIKNAAKGNPHAIKDIQEIDNIRKSARNEQHR